MTFTRAFVIAVMTSLLLRDSSVEGFAAAIGLGGFLWLFTTDPLPAAVKRGLENFAKDYRR
jgi:hypothetical protein